MSEAATHVSPQPTTVPWSAGATQGSHPETKTQDLDRAVADLVAAKDRWAETGIADRIRLLERLQRDYAVVAPGSVEAACQAKGLPQDDPRSGEEWLGGPLCIHRNLRLLIRSLTETLADGAPRIPGPVTERADGQVVAQVFPDGLYDKVLFGGLTAEVWMEKGVTKANLKDNQAAIYKRGAEKKGKVALVLGAGNVASIGPMDVLYKLFVENQVCVLKMNPVNEYLGPFIERGFRALVDGGFLRVVYGGAAVGKHLCSHPGVDEIHITGSDKTHDAIVWGPPGPEREARKKKGEPALTKRITSELGNVSGVVVVPGPWDKDDVAFHALNIASQVQNNGSFNCNAAKLVIESASWEQRKPLLDEIRRILKAMPQRKAYYPGAEERYEAFLKAHANAEALGPRSPGIVPWTLIPDVPSSETNDVCFTSEAFCGVLGETTLDAKDPVEFLEKAVSFLNDVLWGTLNCCIIVHPRTLAEPRFAAAFDKALGALRYGTIGVNVWPALGYGLVSTTWGAYPGHPLDDIQSGRGVVHNTFLFDRPQKSIVRGPFRIAPTPPWFFGHKKAHELGPKLARFEMGPGVLKLTGVIWSAIRG
jgi:acyl-CoA reductase-like NAD-dependent aldehyde dehydrogenase